MTIENCLFLVVRAIQHLLFMLLYLLCKDNGKISKMYFIHVGWWKQDKIEKDCHHQQFTKLFY